MFQTKREEKANQLASGSLVHPELSKLLEEDKRSQKSQKKEKSLRWEEGKINNLSQVYISPKIFSHFSEVLISENISDGDTLNTTKIKIVLVAKEKIKFNCGKNKGRQFC